MPTFQDSLTEIYPESQVQVVTLNKDAPPLGQGAVALQLYVNFIGNISTYYKADTLKYPMIYNPSGSAFTAYDAGTSTNPLPCIFLIDQNGKIRLRNNGASQENQFWPEFTQIMDTTRWLLDHPPNQE